VTVHIGALHADAWTGLVLSREPGEGFAFRFAVDTPRGRADLDDFFWLLHEAGPHEPGGRWARAAFDLDLLPGAGEDTRVLERTGRAPGLTVEWGRVGESTVVGRVRVEFAGTLTARAYLPWDWAGRWEPHAGGGLVGSSASGRSAAALRLQGAGPAVPGPGPGDRDLPRAVAPGTVVRFVASVAPHREGALEAARAVAPEGPEAPGIDALLERAAAQYEERRTTVRGPLEGLAASVAWNLRWMVLLQPESGRLYTPAGRRWIFPVPDERRGPEGRGPVDGRDHWTVFCWDSYFNALELAVEAPETARETLLAGLDTAFPNGCVPNWRGRFGGTADRSQPPVAGLATLSLHLRRPDPDLLRRAYPRLRAWSDWWAGDHGGAPRRRAGPRGLFTWGADLDLVDPLAPPWERGADVRQLAAWESGQDDLPTWDEAEPAQGREERAPGASGPRRAAGERSGVLALDPVDLNAYRVLDLECLAVIADELGRADEAAGLRSDADALRALVNEHLWDPDRETYADRRWDGSFTPCRTASHFLVLAAGIPPDDRARRMVEHLTDPRLFWGDFVVPTISRDDPRFEQQQYWRGTIWPPVNYLVRLGLARYGFDAVAGEVALRGARLFLESWRRTGLCRENFDSRTGEGGGQRHQSWGPLFALSALEELAHVTPWHGLRLGGLRVPSGTRASNLDFGDRGMLDVAAGSEGFTVRRDGREILETRGAVVLRNVVADPTRLAATTRSEAPVELRIPLGGRRWSAEVDGRRAELERPVLRLEEGSHRLEIRSIG
jgi:hypothetical protein